MSYLAIDIGATWIRIGIADKKGIFIDKEKTRTIKKGTKEIFLNSITDAISGLMKKTKIRRVVAIGIGSIGPIDISRGTIAKPPNIEIHDIPIVKYLSEYFNVPTYLVNDCTAAVIAEKYFGQCREFSNIVYITLSSGIGGGAIVDNTVLFGKDGNAVEIGHFVVDIEGKIKCGCGGYGHWEAYTSGANIHKFVKLLIETKYGESINESPLSKIIERRNIKYEDIFECASRGDKIALDILEEVGRINAVGFADVINAFDPEAIMVGGSIALKNPKHLVFDPIVKNVGKYAINRVPKIDLTGLGDDVVLYGALAIAMNPDIIPARFRISP